ncbi:hypothetical protein LWI29_028727 [Acer saccharum]|uniref:Uncharacterized protein n=1 Tax=Acer saccharum TaxID=4024 RepID=A0AA39VWD6_ACESA|nr:hypothetical protein LWI29_028727 [Acer saccharum]
MGFRLSIYQTQISSIKKPKIKKIDTRITTTPIICSSPSTTQHPHHHLQKSSPTPPPHYHQPTINQTLTTSHPNPTFSRRRDRRLGDRRLRQQKKIAGKHHHSGGQETKPSRSMSRTHRLPVTRCHDLRRLMASSSRGGGVVVPVEKIEAAAAVDDEPSMEPFGESSLGFMGIFLSLFRSGAGFVVWNQFTMNAEEVTRLCEALLLKEKEGPLMSLRENMKNDGERRLGLRLTEIGLSDRNVVSNKEENRSSENKSGYTGLDKIGPKAGKWKQWAWDRFKTVVGLGTETQLGKRSALDSEINVQQDLKFVKGNVASSLLADDILIDGLLNSVDLLADGILSGSCLAKPAARTTGFS